MRTKRMAPTSRRSRPARRDGRTPRRTADGARASGRGLLAAALGAAGLVVLAACASPTPAPDAARKIEFDLSALDADGLRGPPDGKVAVSYEFAIPNTEECRARVKAIDPSVRFMPGSRGRIGARPEQCLCIGSTHQPNFRKVVAALAGLDCVERIIECHFE